MVRRLGCRQHEDGVGGRLLQRLQKGVFCVVGKLMGLIEDDDAVARFHRAIADALADGLHLRHAPVAGGVHLNHVYRIALGDSPAERALVARGRCRACFAVHGLGQQPSDGGLAGPAGPCEQICLPDPVPLDGVLKRACDMLLAHDIIERLGAIFSVQSDVWHVLWPGGRRFCLGAATDTGKYRAPGSDKPSLQTPARPGSGRNTQVAHAVSAYRCFLPDLTEFTDRTLHWARPSTSANAGTYRERQTSARGFSPA